MYTPVADFADFADFADSQLPQTRARSSNKKYSIRTEYMARFLHGFLYTTDRGQLWLGRWIKYT